MAIIKNIIIIRKGITIYKIVARNNLAGQVRVREINAGIHNRDNHRNGTRGKIPTLGCADGKQAILVPPFRISGNGIGNPGNVIGLSIIHAGADAQASNQFQDGTSRHFEYQYVKFFYLRIHPPVNFIQAGFDIRGGHG